MPSGGVGINTTNPVVAGASEGEPACQELSPCIPAVELDEWRSLKYH
jgi:hypothetical protein